MTCIINWPSFQMNWGESLESVVNYEIIRQGMKTRRMTDQIEFRLVWHDFGPMHSLLLNFLMSYWLRYNSDHRYFQQLLLCSSDSEMPPRVPALSLWFFLVRTFSTDWSALVDLGMESLFGELMIGMPRIKMSNNYYRTNWINSESVFQLS